MKIVILGASGMLGHKLLQHLQQFTDCYGMMRNYNKNLTQTNIFDRSKIINGIDVFKINKMFNNFSKIQPDVIINCIGVIKQKVAAKNFKESIYINSYLPHLLAEYSQINKIKFIHISTDCVFDGNKGNYSEKDFSNARDLYGKSKFLGEINYDNSLTLRTSIIGHELFTNYSLVDWFLTQNGGSVNGFKNAIYTGFPTIVFAKVISEILVKYQDLKGLMHISSDKINKFDLLTLIKNIYCLNIEIKKDVDFKCDRSLDSSLFRSLTDITMPDWEEMITQMFINFKETKYELWKKY